MRCSPEDSAGREMPILISEAEFRAVYQEWCEGRLTRAEAAARLGTCERTFRRYVTRFREHGSQWWKDPLRAHPVGCRAAAEERAALETLYSEQYVGWTVRHFYERYRGEHGGKRSYTWVKDTLQTAGLVEKRARDAVRNRPREEDSRQPIGRALREGMLIHLIASRHEWTAGQTWDLLLTVDDATNRVHAGFFVAETTIWSIFRGIRETLEKGLFDSLGLGVDLSSRLTGTETAFGGDAELQLERAMSELGVEIVRPERRILMRNARFLRTLRDRLPREMAAEDIVEIDLANRFLTQIGRAHV